MEIIGIILTAIGIIVAIIIGYLQLKHPKPKKPPIIQPKKIYINLPTTSGKIFGRDKELKMLNMAWDNENTNIIYFDALGGVGKTALINEWLNGMHGMKANHYKGAKKLLDGRFTVRGCLTLRLMSL
jgi:hypothetical protein